MNTLLRSFACTALVSAVALSSLAATAANNESRATLADFYAHSEHCVGMVSVIENQTDEQAAAFERASTAAVKVLRQARPNLTQTEALMALKAGCAKALEVQAREDGPGRAKQATSVSQKRRAAARE